MIANTMLLLGIKIKSNARNDLYNEPTKANCDAMLIYYPDRILVTRLAQPRWTTVLLRNQRRAETKGEGTHSGKTLITLPPNRL